MDRLFFTDHGLFLWLYNICEWGTIVHIYELLFLIQRKSFYIYFDPQNDYTWSMAMTFGLENLLEDRDWQECEVN